MATAGQFWSFEPPANSWLHEQLICVLSQGTALQLLRRTVPEKKVWHYMIADVAIRLAKPADAADIAIISRDYIEHGMAWGWRRERVARAIADPDTNVVVVGDPGAIVAFGIMSYADDDAHLLLFAVRRSSQRRGIGSSVLQWLEAVARSAGAKRIRVEARKENSAARSFYNEHGYYEYFIQQAMYDGVLDGVGLEKQLQSDI